MKIEDPHALHLPLSERAKNMKSSAIRDLLKVTARPEIISFAGGLPSPDTFPIARLKDAFDRVLSAQGKVALQYGPTDGYAPLREWIADRMSTDGVRIGPEQVTIVSGSQQGLDLLSKVLIDKGSKVLVETPTYLGALQAFSMYEPDLQSVESDDIGLVPETVARIGQGARLLYAPPNFQNPTGRTLPLSRRRELVAICARMNVPIIEDDPYGELSYGGERLQKMLTMNSAGVVHMGSFSKILTPGIRLGYVIAPPALSRMLEKAKQATDLHTSQLTQMVVYEALKDGFLDQHIPVIRRLYAEQCETMLAAMQDFFPPALKWTRPDGGMFIWVTLPRHIDSQQLFEESVAQDVAFVPGTPFYPANLATNTLRLSFVTVPRPRIREGIERLGKLIASKL
ncbi:PLP-dependent aminotransferase family protein (plasmid) [Massilia forsythiae]|uniref:PLP-dependent aminotransferase family protein n=1 Tax=Massilia forsythiae TaxID=2728020 RepID=A0A7Z2ZVK0_9BURK|nr:PLP-dependent aminotransferase family protein [Massilia forsythiae]QJE03673.1 PLP-dependent aminotransferase family protein [Massilia forsythiae]